jgi:hypothetical protein
MAEVFISYAAEDGEIARYVAERLRGERYDVWYYQGDSQTPGQDYMDNIGDGVRNARVVVLFVSPSAIASPQWLLRRRDARGAPLIRTIALSMLAAVGLWLVFCLLVFTGAGAVARIPDPADRSKLVAAIIAFGMIALLPSAIVFWLFRGARK